MTLKNACYIAEACGLKTIGEAIYNIALHANQLFSYNEIDVELNELRREMETLNVEDLPIAAILN